MANGICNFVFGFGFEKLDLDLVMFMFWICNFVFRFVNFVPKDKRPKKYQIFFLKKLKSVQKSAQSRCKPGPKPV